MGFELLAILLGIWSVSAFDSEGTQFNWNFIRNADPDPNTPNQTLSVTILNGANQGDCTFTMQYREYFTTPLITKSVIVPANSFAEMSVPSYYGFGYDTINAPQTSRVPNVTLVANSTCPVTLLANNYDAITGQGDTFMVFPTTWASRYFTFTLPPAVLTSDPNPTQYQVVTFIPVQGVANISLEVVQFVNSGPLQFTADGRNGQIDYIALPTTDSLPRTYRITSDTPIQVVAGVTCVGVYGGKCDHVAFMPQPVPSFDCRSYEWVDDDHISDTTSTGSFYIDIPSNCPSIQHVNATGAGTGQSRIQSINLDPNKISVLQNFSATTFGRAVGFHAGGSATHLTRFYDSSINGGTGAFLSAVASRTSFISGPSYFYTRDANDTFEIFCEVLACSRMRIDGVMLSTSEFDAINLDGDNYYSFPHLINNSGIHFITFTSPVQQKYTFFVYGKNNGYGYGYLGPVNIPSLVVLPTTVAPPTTSGPSTTSGPTSTSTSSSSTTTTTRPSTTQGSTATSTQKITTSSSTSAVTSSTPGVPSSTRPLVTSTMPSSTSILPTSTTQATTTSPTTTSTIPQTTQSNLITSSFSVSSTFSTVTTPPASVTSGSSSATTQSSVTSSSSTASMASSSTTSSLTISSSTTSSFTTTTTSSSTSTKPTVSVVTMTTKAAPPPTTTTSTQLPPPSTTPIVTTTTKAAPLPTTTTSAQPPPPSTTPVVTTTTEAAPSSTAITSTQPPPPSTTPVLNPQPTTTTSTSTSTTTSTSTSTPTSTPTSTSTTTTTIPPATTTKLSREVVFLSSFVIILLNLL